MQTQTQQETKWKEAIRYYDPIVQKTAGAGGGGGRGDNHNNQQQQQQQQAQQQLLNVPAIVLANLCVSYIMTSQNEVAEELMRKIEKEEETAVGGGGGGYGGHAAAAGRFSPSSSSPQHLCIVNLVIGTLYCAKGNFEFGITRIIKSLEPYDKKLNGETWHYAKRCFMALAENLAKHLLTLKDASLHEILEFLDAAELHGNKIKTLPLAAATKTTTTNATAARRSSVNTVSYEARQIKCLFIKLME